MGACLLYTVTHWLAGKPCNQGLARMRAVRARAGHSHAWRSGQSLPCAGLALRSIASPAACLAARLTQCRYNSAPLHTRATTHPRQEPLPGLTRRIFLRLVPSSTSALSSSSWLRPRFWPTWRQAGAATRADVCHAPRLLHNHSTGHLWLHAATRATPCQFCALRSPSAAALRCRRWRHMPSPPADQLYSL